MISGEYVLNLVTLLLAVTLMFFRNSYGKVRADIHFKRMIEVVVVLVFAATADTFGNMSFNHNYFLLAAMGSYLQYALDPFGYYFTVSYIDCWIEGGNEKGKKAFLILMRVYAYLNFALVTIDSIFGMRWFFYYENYTYNRGEFYMIRAAIQAMFCIVVAIYVIIFKRHINRSIRVPIISYPFIVFLGGVIQISVKGYNFEYMATIYGCLILLLYVQKRNENIDYLTGVYNRRGLDEELKKAVEDANQLKAGSRPFGAVMMDVDHFKYINDRFGHTAGDEVLQSIARITTSYFEDEAIVSRYGGDEFFVLIPNVKGNDLDMMIKGLREELGEIRWSHRDEHKVTVSLGYELYHPGEKRSVDNLCADIDKLMYTEKSEHHKIMEGKELSTNE